MMADLFGKIPGRVRYNTNLTDFAKLLYAEIYTYNLIGETRIKNSDIAEMYGKTKVTVSRAIAELKKEHLITIKGERNDREMRVIDMMTKCEMVIEQKPESRKVEMSQALKTFLQEF